MGRDIQQSVELPASPEALFEMYVDAKQHSALTGSAVTVSREPGSAFSAFGGALSGRMVATVPGRLTGESDCAGDALSGLERRAGAIFVLVQGFRSRLIRRSHFALGFPIPQ